MRVGTFPKQVYAHWTDEGNGCDPEYLIVDTDLDPIKHGSKVGIYALVGLGEVNISTTLKSKPVAVKAKKKR